MNIRYEAMKRSSTTDTWFTWYPVRLGTHGSGRCVWLRRVLRNRDLFETINKWIAWRLPKSLVYWCAIRLIAHSTTGKYSSQFVPELTCINALKTWENDNKL